jgi:response regulator of citrate/malate metabolism
VPAASALTILDSTFDLFKQMGSGIALDLQWQEISRRLHLVRAEVTWTADMAFVAAKLRAHAAHYMIGYRADGGSERIRMSNAARLDKVVEHYSILRAHLEQQLTQSEIDDAVNASRA